MSELVEIGYVACIYWFKRRSRLRGGVESWFRGLLVVSAVGCSVGGGGGGGGGGALENSSLSCCDIIC